MGRGTDFGGIHSYRDLNLIQQTVEEQPAEPVVDDVEEDAFVEPDEQSTAPVVVTVDPFAIPEITLITLLLNTFWSLNNSSNLVDMYS